MRLTRVLVCTLITLLLGSAIYLDSSESFGGANIAGLFTRQKQTIAVPQRHALPESWREHTTWFCPGGSAPGGIADVSLEIVNASFETAQARVTGVRQGLGVKPTEAQLTIEAGETALVRLSELVPESAWMGAVVEVNSANIIVEQTYLGAAGTTDRALCQTRTSDLWLVSSGATRLSERGEELILLILNPFPHDAVLDIRFVSDLGVDTLKGVVVPAGQMIHLDVNSEVPVAQRVSTTIEAVVGQVVVSRLQSQGLVTNEAQIPAALSVASASPVAATRWYLLDMNQAESIDVVTVLNVSATDFAEVDLDILPAQPDNVFHRNPIELTIQPGEAQQVCLRELSRLDGLDAYTIIVRSLGAAPVAVLHESIDLSSNEVSDQQFNGCEPQVGFTADNISLAATIGADIVARTWLAPLLDDEHSLTIFNPSETSIAIIDLSTVSNGTKDLVNQFELAPLARVTITAEMLGVEEPIVEVTSAIPLVVSRKLAGVSQHQLLPAVVASQPLLS